MAAAQGEVARKKSVLHSRCRPRKLDKMLKNHDFCIIVISATFFIIYSVLCSSEMPQQIQARPCNSRKEAKFVLFGLKKAKLATLLKNDNWFFIPPTTRR